MQSWLVKDLKVGHALIERWDVEAGEEKEKLKGLHLRSDACFYSSITTQLIVEYFLVPLRRHFLNSLKQKQQQKL